MKKAVIAITLAAFVFTGCTGSFNLTRKVYNWHRSQSDKWVDEIGFLVVALLPVYGLSMLADAIVFNSIEFWTGNNPVKMALVPNEQRFIKSGNSEAKMSFEPWNNRITISSSTNNRPNPTITLEKVGDKLVTKDANGNVMSTIAMTGDGGYQVFDKNEKLVRNYTPDDVQRFKDQLSE